MFIINHKKFFVLFSVVLVVLSIFSMFYFKLPLGIDFKGGALTEISYTNVRPDISIVNKTVSDLGYGASLVQPIGETDFSIKTRDLTEMEHTALVTALSMGGKYPSIQKSFTSVGPSVGQELTRKAITASIVVSLAIIMFIAFAFRGVSKPVRSWKYGVIAIITLLHDIAIPVGVFAILARHYGVEIDTLFVVALLTILGLSISDTIVVFDRIRENLKNKNYPTFPETVGNSLTQAYTRSINTSLTVIIVLITLAIVGPVTTKVFALMLASGMFFGTYSSIFLASPLLVYFEEWKKK